MPGQDKQTTTSAPWGPAQAGLKNVIGQASNLYSSGQPFLAPQSAATTQSQSMISQMAGAPSTVSTAGLQGMLNQGTSPEFMSALDTQAEKLGTDISRQFGMLGRGGSVAHQNALVDQVGNLRTSAMANELARQQGVNLGILGQIAGIDQANSANQYLPAQMLAGVGAQQDARAQADSPWGRLGTYGQLMSGLGSMGGTTTQTQSLSPLSQIAGLAGPALSLAAGIPSFGSLGALGGAAATGVPMAINGMFGGMSPYFGVGSGLY